MGLRMFDVRGWLTKRYGSVLFALLLLGIYDEAMKRWRVAEALAKFRLDVWFSAPIVTFKGRGMSLRQVRTPLGKLAGHRGELLGLALFLMFLGAGARST